MPTARELLEQADALMRRNRSQDVDDIPVLTDSVAELPGARTVHPPAAATHRPVPAPLAGDDEDSIPTLTERVEPEIEVAPEAVGEPSDWLQHEAGEPSVTGDIPDSVLIVPPAEDAGPPEEEPVLDDLAAPSALRTRARGLIAFDETAQTEEIEVVAPPTSDAAENLFDDEFAGDALAASMATEHGDMPEAAGGGHEAAARDETAARDEAAAHGGEGVAIEGEAVPDVHELSPHAPTSFDRWRAYDEPQSDAYVPAVPIPPLPDESVEDGAPPVRDDMPTSTAWPLPPALDDTSSELASPLLPALNEALEEVAPPVEPVQPGSAFVGDTASEELAAASASQGGPVTLPVNDTAAGTAPAPASDTPASAAPTAVSDSTAVSDTATGAAPAPATVPFRDDARWEGVAEEIRMQVLQRIDIFTDTGLREQLAMRLQPIVDRASADLVATINQHVGELLRSYVAEAIEREIESWRRSH